MRPPFNKAAYVCAFAALYVATFAYAGPTDVEITASGSLPPEVRPKDVKMEQRDTSLVPKLVLTSQAVLPGPIPAVFLARVNYTNTTAGTQSYTVEDGFVYVDSKEPLEYQFVVVLKGVSIELDPG